MHAGGMGFYKLSVHERGREWTLIVIKRPQQNRWFVGMRQSYNVAVEMGAHSLSWGAFYKKLSSSPRAVMELASRDERKVLVEAGALSPQAPSAALVSAGTLAVVLRDIRALPAALGEALIGLVEGTTMLQPLEVRLPVACKQF